MSSAEKNLAISVLLDFYGEMLTEKQREVTILYYDDDLSLAEIAEHSGITRQGVRDSIKRAEAQLLDYEEKLGLYARFAEIQSSLAEIIRHAGDLQHWGSRMPNSGEIFKKTGRIIELASSINV